MANVLTQAEIDELLNAMSAGTPAPEPEPEKPSEPVIVKYDFSAADRFPKDQIRTLQFVYENFARFLGTHLSGILRINCEVEVLSVEEMKFSEYNNSLPSPVLLSVLNMPPLQGSTLMEISSEVVYTLINRLFGGTGSVVDSSKNFTEIELAIIERIVRKFMGMIVDSWARITKIDAFLDRIETNSQFAQITPMNEKIALVTMNVQIGDTSGLINICLPHEAIEPISKQLNTRTAFTSSSSNRKQESRTDTIRGRLTNATVMFSVSFEETTASVRDVMSLQVGDVIQLNHNVKEPLTAKVEDNPKYKVAIGTHSNRYAVQIADVIEEEAEYE